MIQNIRDLGGLRTADGGVIRKGMLVRSANLGEAKPEDLAGISTVIDIRTTVETQEKPDKVYGQEYLHLPVFDQAVKGVSREKKSMEELIPGPEVFDMKNIYATIVRERAEDYRRVLLTIMGHDFSTGAVLWHCTEGKDRCGLTTAMLLEAIGVPRDAIMEDYLKTNLVNLKKAEMVRDKMRAEKGDDAAEKFYKAIIADASYLESAWNEMGDNYIRDRLKLDDKTIGDFRRIVLE